MGHEATLEFIRGNRRGVLATRRRDGGVQISPVVAAVDGANRVVVSTREGAMKTVNLRRDPHATYCAISDRFFGEWHTVEGSVEIVSLPEAMEALVDYYRQAGASTRIGTSTGEAMQKRAPGRAAATVERSGPTRTG